jgi:hypothetical protein
MTTPGESSPPTCWESISTSTKTWSSPSRNRRRLWLPSWFPHRPRPRLHHGSKRLHWRTLRPVSMTNRVNLTSISNRPTNRLPPANRPRRIAAPNRWLTPRLRRPTIRTGTRWKTGIGVRMATPPGPSRGGHPLPKSQADRAGAVADRIAIAVRAGTAGGVDATATGAEIGSGAVNVIGWAIGNVCLTEIAAASDVATNRSAEARRPVAPSANGRRGSPPRNVRPHVGPPSESRRRQTTSGWGSKTSCCPSRPRPTTGWMSHCRRGPWPSSTTTSPTNSRTRTRGVRRPAD